MSMKSVLVPMESHAGMESVLRTAVLWRDDMTAILKGSRSVGPSISLSWTLLRRSNMSGGSQLRRSVCVRRLKVSCEKMVCLARARGRLRCRSAG
jgi:hypothetical protein